MTNRNIARSLSVRWRRIFGARRFFGFGRGVYIFERVEISNPAAIDIGSDVVIQRDCYLAARKFAGDGSEPRLIVGAGSNIGPRNHIFAHSEVKIGEKVLTAPNVFISDCTHEYSDPTVAIVDQPVRPLTATSIGSHSWIGYGCVIVGCKIGKHCVIGANSVVLSDIPDYSVAVGAPAKVVRRLKSEVGAWIPVTKSSPHSERGEY